MLIWRFDKTLVLNRPRKLARPLYTIKRELEVIDLPNRIVELLEEVDSPERLKRHLQIVYSTASELVNQIKQEWPTIVFNEELILFGAGTHDIGKSLITKELYEKGRKHELKGKYLLQNHGFKIEEARFAFTHGNWQEENLTIEDLIVSLSDKIWKGKRIAELEEKVGKIISDNLNIDYWEVYVKLDEILVKLSNKSDELILWQNQ
ncbi:phosphohydrolase [Marinifilum breve]|uniref:Phosphohydrolase n=1 Tax=Marinifilum breve TaxID=2184082 RepID=A0A2V4AEP5_9BACT|nr:phosphohydrolase [Marinifilum breve]